MEVAPSVIYSLFGHFTELFDERTHSPTHSFICGRYKVDFIEDGEQPCAFVLRTLNAPYFINVH